MKTRGQPFQVRTGRPVRDDAVPRQPHERDESADSQESAPRSDMEQAYLDVMSGQQDTDCREQRGVESVLKDAKDQGACPGGASDVSARTPAPGRK